MRALVALLSLLATATASAAEIRGAVYSSDGIPVAKARISAYRVESTPVAAARIAAGSERTALATAESGDDGTFVLDPKAEGAFELIASKDGFAPLVRYELAGTDAVLTLRPAEMRRGRVTSGGKPVADAQVVVYSRGSAALTTRTDAGGTFTIPDPKAFATSLTILHPDFAFETVFLHQPQAARLDISLESGHTVSGSVVDASGKPVAKATILQSGWPVGTSSDDGTFTIKHVHPQAKTIGATSGTMRGTTIRAPKENVIRLEPGRSLTGSVRDSAKKAVPGTAVWVTTGSFDGSEQVAVADDKGEFRLDSLPAAAYTAVARGGDALRFERQQAELTRKETARLEFVGVPVTMLRGIVRDENKRPVAGASVRVMTPREPVIYVGDMPGMGGQRTGPDGRFRIAYGIPTAGPSRDLPSLRVGAMHPRFAAAVSDPIEVADGQTPREVTITLPAGIEVKGIAVDRDEKPVAGAEIVLLQDSTGAMPYPIDVSLQNRHISPFVRSAADGTFTVRLNAVPHDVAAWKEGFSGARIGGFDPGSGKPLHLVLEPGLEIRGRVAGGVSATDASVSASSDDGSYAIGTVDPSGAFTIANLSAGIYRVMLHVGALSAEKQVRAPARDVVLELPASGEIRGRVTDKATGAPLASGFHVSVGTGDDYGDGYLPGGADGTFGGPVATGTKQITVTADGYLSSTQTVEIQAGKPTEIAVALGRGRRIHGRVTSADGKPLAEARVTLGEGGERYMTEMFMDDQHKGTDASGEYELRAVSIDAVSISATRAGYLSRTIAIEPGDRDRALDIVLPSGRKAIGRVIDETGAAIEGAEVWASGAGHESGSQRTKSDAGGNFTVEGLGAGRHTFRASKARFGSASVADVDIAAGPVVITLRSAGASGTIRGKVAGYAEGRWMMGSVSATPVSGTGDRDAGGPIARDGTFRIEDAPPGELYVHAMAMSMDRQTTTPRVKVTLPAGGDVEANLAIRTDVVVRGVVTESGRPAPGRRVGFYGGGVGQWQATTGEDGTYEIVGIEPGTYEVGVQAGRNSFQTQHVVTGSGTFDIEIAFATINGRVFDDAGAPLAGATVDVENGSYEGAITDAAGSFSLKVSGTEARTISASKSGYAHGSVSAQPNGPPVVLKLARSDGLRVRLVDARDGTTLGGYVVATDARGANIPNRNSPERDGTLLVPLAHGSYRIAASADGFASQSVRATVPMAGELRMALTPGGTLIIQADRESRDLIKLVLPNGEEYVRCHCNGIAEIRLTGQTTRIEHVAPGSYAMQVLDARGKVKAAFPVTVTEGQTTTAAIKLPNG